MYFRIVLLWLVILIASVGSRAQSAHPDFRSMIAQSASDTQKLAVYKQVYDYYNKAGNNDSLYTYLQEGLENFTAHNYNYGKASILAMISDNYAKQLDALQLAEQHNKEKKDLIVIIAVVLAITLVTLLIFFFKGRGLNMQLTWREQELQKANDIKDRLFSILGHDLKGPIGNIPILLEIYNDENTPDEEKKFILESLQDNSRASLDTLEKLLNWGKLQLKGVTINKAPFQISEIITDKLRLFKVSAASKNIAMVNNVPPELKLYADENHFKFIVRNLLSNAIKYTREGGCVEINAQKKDGKYIVFSVKDNGIGMDEERKQHIFEPYNKSTAGTNNELGNSIGLMLCREFTLQNGGDIWVTSEPGNGTTFYFTMMGSDAAGNN